MHYISYEPGSVARVTEVEEGSRFAHEDVNVLSQVVAKFNDWLNKDELKLQQDACGSYKVWLPNTKLSFDTKLNKLTTFFQSATNN